MKLFATVHMSWNEPVFFVPRMRDRKAWLLRLVLVLIIAGCMLAAFRWDQNARQRVDLWQAVLASLGIGALLTAAMDAPNYQREVSISSDSISCIGVAGRQMTMGTWALPDVHSAHLVRPVEIGRSFGLLLLDVGGSQVMMGVPGKVSMEKIATVLHRLQIPVQLSGWVPPPEPRISEVKEEIALAPEMADTAEPIRVWPVRPEEGRLNPPGKMAVAVLIGFGPLLVALLSAVGVGVYLFVAWQRLTFVERGIFMGGAVLALVGSFMYLLWAGQYIASRYLIRAGREVIQLRPEAVVNANDPELITVEVFDRQSLQSAVIKAVDFGFLLLDSRTRCMLFEGDKNRWRIPAGAIRSCRIEEVHVGAEGEAAREKRYYVVVAGDLNGQLWEAPMVRTRTEFGSNDDDKRYRAAQWLFGRMAAIIPSVGQTRTM